MVQRLLARSQHRRQSPASRQALTALREGIVWIQQPAFDKAFADITGTRCDHDEWRREVNWNYTADDQSFT